jgi:hypothetical protein
MRVGDISLLQSSVRIVQTLGRIERLTNNEFVFFSLLRTKRIVRILRLKICDVDVKRPGDIDPATISK